MVTVKPLILLYKYNSIQRMLVGYYDDQGILVYHPARTAAHYLKGGFALDVLGALPMEILDKGRTTFIGKLEN